MINTNPKESETIKKQQTHTLKQVNWILIHTLAVYVPTIWIFFFFLREPFFVIEPSKWKRRRNEEEMYLNTNRINYYLSSQFLFTKYGQNGTFIPLPHAIRFAYRYAFITNRIRWIDSRLYIFYDVYYYLVRRPCFHFNFGSILFFSSFRIYLQLFSLCGKHVTALKKLYPFRKLYAMHTTSATTP